MSKNKPSVSSSIIEVAERQDRSTMNLVKKLIDKSTLYVVDRQISELM